MAHARNGSVIMRLINFTTEALDWIDAFYKALPQELQRRNANPFQKMLDLYENVDKIDIAQALINVAEATGEDRYFGGVGRDVGAASRRLGEWTGRPFGIDVGRGFWPT